MSEWSMPPTGPPAERPCAWCPYRRDVPPGVWAREEYARLPDFDLPTPQQPPTLFLCHEITGNLCAGWVGCHDMAESLGLRVALIKGVITPETLRAAEDYVSPVELFRSGAEAARHGLSAPTTRTRAAMRKVNRVHAEHPCFHCPRCGARSWSPHDVVEGYCAACHDWTGQTFVAYLGDRLDAVLTAVPSWRDMVPAAQRETAGEVPADPPDLPDLVARIKALCTDETIAAKFAALIRKWGDE